MRGKQTLKQKGIGKTLYSLLLCLDSPLLDYLVRDEILVRVLNFNRLCRLL